MRTAPAAPVFHSSAIRTISLLATAVAMSACGSASGPGSMATASLPMRPSEGLVARPYTGHAPASTLGAPRANSQNYNWNGNRDRLQAGAAPAAAYPITAPPRQTAPLIWKASPQAAALPAAASVTAPAAREVVVAKGDTLYSLANKHNVSMSSLMDANHLTSPNLKVSQRLVLPAASR